MNGWIKKFKGTLDMEAKSSEQWLLEKNEPNANAQDFKEQKQSW